jgi:hypothetical protein
MGASFYTAAALGLLLGLGAGPGIAAAPARAAPAGEAGAAEGDGAYDARVDALRARVEARPETAALARAVAARLPDVARDPESIAARVRERIARLALSVRRVPGLFYVSHPWTGADLARIEGWLGLAAPLVATDELGTVDENARIVGEALRAEHAAGRRLVVWSASKGSADLLAALAREPEGARAVVLWIDLVGLLDGTPLTDPGASPEELASIGLPEATARSLSRAERAPALARTPWPPALRVVHVAGFPHAAAISPRARAGFERLRALGPNDGWLLLEGLARRRGPVLVVPGADHYLGAADLRARMLALLDVELEALERPRGRVQ